MVNNSLVSHRFRELIKQLNPTDYKIIISNPGVLKELYRILEDLINLGAKKAEIEIRNSNITPPISEIAQRVSSMRYCFIDKLAVRIKDVPYCLVKQPESFVYFSKDRKKQYKKLSKCQKCKFNSRCRGMANSLINLFDYKQINPLPDLPREVMIEIEEKCNLDCQFCFNKNAFARHGRDINNQLTTKVTKDIIRSIAQANISIVRFTGGEPLLRHDIWELADYAKEKGLEVRLNTNSLLVNNKSIAKKISNYFDNVLIPIQYTDVLDSNAVTKSKIKAIKLLQEAGIKKLRTDTVATKTAIRNLNKIYKFIKSLGIDKWELNRPIPTSKSNREINNKDVKKLVDKLLIIRKRTSETHYIINAIPFCGYYPLEMQTVAIGAYACDGHERLVIDPRGFAKPIYYMEKDIGNPLDILSCWNHPFMKKMRTLQYVPKECKNCIYLEKCRGGCRFSAHFLSGNYGSPDPLADISNKIQ